MKTLSFIFCGFLIFSSCEKKQESVELKGEVFGTYYHIQYRGTENYATSIHSLFEEMILTFSTYTPESDISKFNEGNLAISINKHFQTVLEKSREIHKNSKGAFDPTLGLLVNAWGFGPKPSEGSPNALKVGSLMKKTGLEKVMVKNGKAYNPKGVFLDFNGIAKGYAVDVIGNYLEEKGLLNYIVEIGGEIRARGKKQEGKNWQVGIERPMENEPLGKNIFFKFPLKDQSIATSGNYRKFKRDKKNGKTYSHTIDHKTGYPVESNILSVSVIAQDCMSADGYATAFMALGLEKSKELIVSHPDLHLEAMIIYRDNKEKMEVYKTKGFPKSQ